MEEEVRNVDENEQFFENFSNILKVQAEKYIGYKQKSGKIWKEPRKLRNAITRRNCLCKAWKAALSRNDDKEDIEERWKIYKIQAEQVSKLRSEHEKKINDRKFEECEKKGISNVNNVWKEMKGMKSNLHEITCLEDGNGKTVSEPSKIKNMIEDYISNLF